MIFRRRIARFAGIILFAFHAACAAPVSIPAGTTIYAGGVAGLDALANPDNSIKFRMAGGGLYLHNNGWSRLTTVEQRQIVTTFQDRPVAIELGFKEGPAPWASHLKSAYLSLGIAPAFIAANAFDGNNLPTTATWAAYSAALRATGLPRSTLILPTFEYANFGANLSTLTNNTVSRRQDFQEIIQAAGGLVLDAPPGYALNREENYRSWLYDAIQWTHRRKLPVVWIASPHTYFQTYQADTEKFLSQLVQHDAAPDTIVCENYNDQTPADFPNVVGNENQPETTLGVALRLLELHK
jgi:hypothetical protein